MSGSGKRIGLAGVTALVLAGTVIGVLPGCGGGGGVLAPGSGGTGTAQSTTAVGPISGFGSIIVNGVHYDESSASLVDDSGRSVARDALRLGMMVRIDGTANASTGTGTAASIQVFSELKGLVDSVGTDSVMVAGRTVRLLSNTVRDGFATLNAGQFVEVYGYFDASSGDFTANPHRTQNRRRIQTARRGQRLEPDAAAIRTGSSVVAYAGVTLPGGFAIGRSVVYASAAPTGNQWQSECGPSQ
ncbi:MAG: DUF5666 domain-containing protein [Burkholderiaceae bacterium]